MKQIMTSEDFMRLAEREHEITCSSGLRFGQTVYNLLVVTHPDLAHHINGTEHDPFHVEHGPRLKRCLNYIAEHWEDEFGDTDQDTVHTSE